MTILEIYFDGSCVPQNPGGTMGWGFIVKLENTVLHKRSGGFKSHPKNTNNKAEYHALISALDWLKNNEHKFIVERVQIKGDSRLVINQMSGIWKVKSESIRKLAQYAMSRANEILITNSLGHREEESQFAPVEFIWVPREQNTEADVLAYNAAVGMT